MDDSRRVVAGIDTLQRIADHGAAQIAFCVALMHTGIHGLPQGTAGDVDILSKLDEDHGHAGILADGEIFLTGCLQIGDQVVKNCLADRGLLLLRSGMDAGF